MLTAASRPCRMALAVVCVCLPAVAGCTTQYVAPASVSSPQPGAVVSGDSATKPAMPTPLDDAGSASPTTTQASNSPAKPSGPATAYCQLVKDTVAKHPAGAVQLLVTARQAGNPEVANALLATLLASSPDWLRDEWTTYKANAEKAVAGQAKLTVLTADPAGTIDEETKKVCGVRILTVKNAPVSIG